MKRYNFKKDDNTFSTVYGFGFINALCTIYLQEAYHTYGALEFFTFANDKDLYLPFLSLVESFNENMNMAIIHLKPKAEKKVPVNSQSVSDVICKYTLRALKALTHKNFLIQRPENDSSDINFNLNGFISSLNFEEFRKIAKDLHIIMPDQEIINIPFRDDISNDLKESINLLNDSYFYAVTVNCLMYFNRFLENINTIKKYTGEGERMWYHYDDDGEKKILYLNQYIAFVNERSDDNSASI